MKADDGSGPTEGEQMPMHLSRGASDDYEQHDLTETSSHENPSHVRHPNIRCGASHLHHKLGGRRSR